MDGPAIIASLITFFGTPSNWCKNTCAMDADGKPCGPLSPNAVKWDVYGYLCKINYEQNGENYAELHNASNLVKEKITGKNFDLEKWNDSFDNVADIINLLS